jgi:hypothetical protein
MNGLELLEKYPLTTKVIKDWFIEQMVESFKEETVPEDFKNFMMEQGIDNDKIGTLIDVNPRMLFDVFDQHKVFIETFLYPDKTFTCKIGDQATTNSWEARKVAEAFAVEAAFEILEKQLTPEEQINENE